MSHASADIRLIPSVLYKRGWRPTAIIRQGGSQYADDFERRDPLQPHLAATVQRSIFGWLGVTMGGALLPPAASATEAMLAVDAREALDAVKATPPARPNWFPGERASWVAYAEWQPQGYRLAVVPVYHPDDRRPYWRPLVDGAIYRPSLGNPSREPFYAARGDAMDAAYREAYARHVAAYRNVPGPLPLPLLADPADRPLSFAWAAAEALKPHSHLPRVLKKYLEKR